VPWTLVLFVLIALAILVVAFLATTGR